MENSQGNPESIGMTEGSFESAEAKDAGSEAFFDALDNEVNGQVRSDDTEVTQNQKEVPTSNVGVSQDDGSNNVQVHSTRS